jgi:hypothetical protein
MGRKFPNPDLELVLAVHPRRERKEKERGKM